MTEYDLFVSSIPMIAEIAIRCKYLNQQDYEAFKSGVLNSASEAVKEFVVKVFIVIEKFR